MTDKKISGFIVGLVVGIILMGLILSPLFESYKKENCKQTFRSGFWINEVYNTCYYFDLNGDVIFDGYCFDRLPEKQSIEDCITGCELGIPYGEDDSYCISLCKEHLLEG